HAPWQVGAPAPDAGRQARGAVGAVGALFSVTLEQRPPQAVPAVPVHPRSTGTQSQEVELVARQIDCGGQLPPHSPVEPGALQGWSVVVVVLLVVVVVGVTTVFSTGAHSSGGRFPRRFDSRPT